MYAPIWQFTDGTPLPSLGLGTFGSDHADPDQVAQAVYAAIGQGYRMIDCAACYGNEPQVGRAIARALADFGLQREDLFITGKLWNDQHDHVAQALSKSLEDLGLTYLDLYLVHWPFPNYHAPFAAPDARNPDSRPYSHEEFMACWRQMEVEVDAGRVRHIGTSNMTISKLTGLLADCRIAPAANEMELHPHFQQPELFAFCKSRGIQPIGFCPIGSPHRPERDRTETDTDPLKDPVIRQIAQAHGTHAVAVCLKWAHQRGQIPIPFSTNPAHIADNLASVCADPLTPAEMEAIAGIDRNCRLIKGQVFLWPGAQGWEDLWQ